MSAKRGAKKRRKTTAQSTVPTGALIQQEHGGALRNGGTNRGGPGRPAHAIRADFRDLLHKHGTGFLKQVLAGTVPLQTECPECGYKPKTKVRLQAVVPDRLNAVNSLARFGIGMKDSITVISPEVRARVQQTVALISSREEWKTADLLDLLDPVWTYEPGE